MIPDSHRIEAPLVTSWVRSLLEAVNVPEAFSSIVTDIFIRAHARRMGHHDLSYLPQRLKWLQSGTVNPRPQFSRIVSAPAVEVWDADEGLGELAAAHITDRAVELARRAGIGYCSIRRSNHFLAAAPHVERAAEQGYFAMIWSNTDAGMSFPGGTTRQIGNNPLGFSVPRGPHSAPWSVDLSLAYSSLGNLQTAKAEGKKLPPWWGVDALGNSTGDPVELEKGGVRPVGEHKGFSLALLGEVMTGILSAGATLDQVAPGGGLNTHNQMVIAWNLDVFGGEAEIGQRVSNLLERVHKLDANVRVPGEQSSNFAQSVQKEGLEISSATLRKLQDWSLQLGVEIPL